jgi:hypothetical protein
VQVIHPRSLEEFGNDTGVRSYDQKSWLWLPGKRFLIRGDADVIALIEKGKARLEDVCEVSQGIIVYKTREEGARNLYMSDGPKGALWKKLLDTESTIQRYALFWGGRYLKYGDWLWCPRDPRFFSLP